MFRKKYVQHHTKTIVYKMFALYTYRNEGNVNICTWKMCFSILFPKLKSLTLTLLTALSATCGWISLEIP